MPMHPLSTAPLSGLSPLRCNPASPSLGDTRLCSTEAVQLFAESHWAHWFEDPLPLLNNQTPIEASASAEGQERLLKLLRLYAAQGAFHPAKPNIPWLRMPTACSDRDHQLSKLQARCPKLVEIIECFVENHWTAWFHEAQEMLLNETPIQASKSTEGKERLENLFGYYSKFQDRFNPLNPNIKWLRRQLQMEGGDHFWPQCKVHSGNCTPEFVLRSFFGDEPLGFFGSTVPFPKDSMILRNKGIMYRARGQREALLPASPRSAVAATDDSEQKYGHLYPMLEAGDLDYWCLSAEGVLATIVLCDQASKSIFRDHPKAWLFDARAQHVALIACKDSALMQGMVNLHPSWLHFFVQPFMHAEDSRLQAKARELLVAHLTNASSVYEFHPKYKYHADYKMMCSTLFELDMHAEVIARFGRFFIRNKVLARENTVEESAALDEGVCFGMPGWSSADAKASWNAVNPQFKF